MIWSILGIFFGGWWFVYGFRMLKRKRIIENTPTSKIRSLAMGIVEVFGRVVPLGKAIAVGAFTKKEGVYSRTWIEEERGSGKHRRWVTMYDNTEKYPFYIQDETGKAMVKLEDAEIDIPPAFTYTSGTFKDPPKEVQEFLKNKGMDFEGFLGMNKHMRYREWTIGIGDSLYIFGKAEDNPLVEEGTSKNNSDDIIIQKGSEKGLFFVSNKSEKEILSKLKWKVFGGIYGGGAVFATGLATLIVMFI